MTRSKHGARRPGVPRPERQNALVLNYRQLQAGSAELPGVDQRAVEVAPRGGPFSRVHRDERQFPLREDRPVPAEPGRAFREPAGGGAGCGGVSH